jgi:flavorubredoxin
MSRVEQISDNIFVLSDLEPASSARSWLPADASGFEPFNKFVFLEGDCALLIETGAAAHDESLQESLREIVKDRLLVILPTRSELESIGNMGSIIDNFPRVELITTTRALPPLGLAHMRPERRQSVKARRLVRGEKLASLGFPTLDTISPIIRILNTIWIYDHRSGVLFTSDFFSNELLPDRETPVIRRDAKNLPDSASLRRSILARFDWLERARTGALEKQWDDLFGRIKPKGLAPSLGRVTLGRDVASDVFDLYRRALFEVADG